MMDIHFEQLINQKMFACSVYSALLQYIMKLWKICHNPIGNVMEDCEAKKKINIDTNMVAAKRFVQFHFLFSHRMPREYFY